jgi:hypothetical protein
MKKFTITAIFLLAFLQIFSLMGQNRQLIPLEVQEAFKKGTRSFDGNPGPNYWENHAKYKIQARLLADESALEGSEKVVYFNNSPDTLKSLVIRLYQDVLRKGGVRAWGVDPNAVTNGVQLKYFRINGKEVKLPAGMFGFFFGTNRTARLPQPLAPGDSLILETAWRFKISEKAASRMGNYGHGRFFVAYWYPQIAVYDDVSGWDKIEFNGITEFYNDFNDFDVELTAPEGYAVWATGHLENADDVYKKNTLKKIREAMTSDKVIPVITQDDWNKNRVLKLKGENTWHFTASNVTDFSFAAAPKYNWDASSVLVDSAAGRRVRVDAIYPDQSKTFGTAALVARKSIEFQSYQWPGVPYPFEHMTSFSNGTPMGGMETPMMANDGDPKDQMFLANLVFHEISHSYFPFYMGTNEKKYAWMDEGWAAYLSDLFTVSLYPHYPEFIPSVKNFNSKSGREMEQPLMLPSNLYTDFRYYQVQAYTRSSLAYRFLRDAIGDATFANALHEYIRRWHGKHPIPFDFFNTFSQMSGQDLTWFIQPWFFDRAYADQGIKKITNRNQVVVQNIGGLPMPVKVHCFYTDGSEASYVKSTAVWKTGDQAVIVQADTTRTIKKVVIGAPDIPDVNPANNSLEK